MRGTSCHRPMTGNMTDFVGTTKNTFLLHAKFQNTAIVSLNCCESFFWFKMTILGYNRYKNTFNNVSVKCFTMPGMCFCVSS